MFEQQFGVEIGRYPQENEMEPNLFEAVDDFKIADAKTLASRRMLTPRPRSKKALTSRAQHQPQHQPTEGQASAAPNVLPAESPASSDLPVETSAPCDAPIMDHAYYEEQLTSANEANKQLEESNKNLRSVIKTLESSTASKDSDILAKEGQISQLTSINRNLTSQLQDERDNVENVTKAQESTDLYLNEAYADLRDAKAATKLANKQKEEAEYEHQATQLKLNSLREEWEAEHSRVQELESALEATNNLQDQIESYEEEATQWHAQIAGKNQEINVKDARIHHLEEQLQKALKGQLSAKAAAEEAQAAAAAATNEPQIDTFNPNPSLEDEFAELGDDLDGDIQSSYDYNLGFSDIQETINISPIEPAVPLLAFSNIKASTTTPIEPAAGPLAFSNIQSAETVPIAPSRSSLAFSSIQSVGTSPIGPTKSPLTLSNLETSETTPIEVAKPSLTFSSIRSVGTSPIEPTASPLSLSGLKTAETVPAEAKKQPLAFSSIQSTATEPIQPAVRSLASTSVQTDDLELAPPTVRYVSVGPKPFTLMQKLGWLLLAAFFGLVSACLLTEPVYDSSYNHHGAFGYPVTILGIIPIGHDVGHSWWSEQLARYAASVLSTIEPMIGVDRTPLY